MSGYYEDEYARVNGEWKMRESRYTLLSNLCLGNQDGLLAIRELGRTPGLVTQAETET